MTGIIYPFQVSGEFITKTARSWFYEERRPCAKVLQFLLSCMCGTSCGKKELLDCAHGCFSYP